MIIVIKRKRSLGASLFFRLWIFKKRKWRKASLKKTKRLR
jgi:hypothetical protein